MRGARAPRNFERALRAEVRDALWFLTRQWQFGEFRGEDAGSPVDVRTAVLCAPLQHYAVRGGPAAAFDGSTPLQTRVERERLPNDLLTHVQIGRAFEARLTALSAAALASVRAEHHRWYPPAIEGVEDARAAQLKRLAGDRLFNGVAFLDEVADGRHLARVAASVLSGAVKAAVNTAASHVAADYGTLYQQPQANGEPPAWVPERLEYQFRCAAEVTGAAQTVLTSVQYASGRLDWYGFNVDPRPEARLTRPAGDTFTPPTVATKPLSFVPAPVSFAGMPAHRYWELENRRIEFADIDAQTTDIAKLLLTEFMLVYGNDWCIVPCEVEVGSVCEILGMIVTDTFGQRMLVRPADRGGNDEQKRWTLFTLSVEGAPDRTDARWFLPPALPRMMEGPSIETVAYLRDEMANLVWAVEQIVPGQSGRGIDGYAAAAAGAPAASGTELTPIAPVRYVLGIDVPANWRPFLPVHLPDSVARSVCSGRRCHAPGRFEDSYCEAAHRSTSSRRKYHAPDVSPRARFSDRGGSAAVPLAGSAAG